MRYEKPQVTLFNAAQRSIQSTDKSGGKCFDGGSGAANTTSASAYEVDE